MASSEAFICRLTSEEETDIYKYYLLQIVERSRKDAFFLC